MAVGVILVFRSTRVINFAIGEMGGFSAALLYRLVVDWDVPFWLSFVACIAVGAVFGAALELLIVRRLFTAPRVILLVALIGAAQLLLFFQLILPDVTQVRPYPTPFSKTWEVGGVIVRSEELTVLVVIPLLVARAVVVPEPHEVRARHPRLGRQRGRGAPRVHQHQADVDARVGDRRERSPRSPRCSSPR